MRYRVPSADRNPQQDLHRDRQPGAFTISAGPPGNSSGGPPKVRPHIHLVIRRQGLAHPIAFAMSTCAYQDASAASCVWPSYQSSRFRL